MGLKLLRLATLHLNPVPEGWRDWEIRLGSALVRTLSAWEIDEHLHLLVVAEVDLADLPGMSDDGFVVIPELPRRQAETAIETSANIIAICERCRRSISSPTPSIAFLPDNQEVLEWLDATNGIVQGGHRVTAIEPRVVLAEGGMTEAFLARSDGVALLAEALAHHHPTGRFHELLKVFERAFSLSSKNLVHPLAKFLETSGHEYTEAEVTNWVVDLRHPATHADKKDLFLLEADVRPVIPRMEQAAYDVLFNKTEWRSPSTDRRKVWSPSAGLVSESGSVYMSRSDKTPLRAQLLDAFRSYPVDLDAGLVELPEGWWAKPADVAKDR